ncbi:MAG: NAD-dependent epimerase/dehydratase family protein, partial [Vicinamibacterales bacterium]
MQDTVCVTGASGGIGQALLAQLVGRYQVKALFRTRSAVSAAWESRGGTVVCGDLADEAALAQLVEGARFVFHCAALVTPAAYAEAYAINVEGTRRLARLAAGRGCQRLVHVSSIAAYSGTAVAGDFTEDLALDRREDMAVYALTKLESELAVQEASRASRLEYVILRPTSVYGPHTKSHTQIPVEMIRKGLPAIIGDGGGLTDAVYVDDVARALVLAAETPAANGETFNIGHEAVTYHDFYAAYGAMLNRPVRRVPARVVGGLVRFLEVAPGSIRTRTADVRKGARLLLKMARNVQRYPSAKAQAVLGYAPAFDLMTGMLKTELWLKREARVGPTEYALDGYGTLPFRPAAVVHPANEAQLAQVVRIAGEAGVTVRAIGSLHSSSPVPYTDGVCIVLDRYRELLGVDGELVTVQGGMKIRELNDALASLKLALPVNGAITAQSVTGAISTGTHGGSRIYGSVSDTVEAVRLIRADGEIVEIGRSHELFPAVVVSCGLLGILSTVTFRCVPAFVLQSRHAVHPAAEVIERFDEIHRRSPYTCVFYFPVNDQMEVLDINPVEHAPVEPVAAVPAVAAPGRPFSNTRLGRIAIRGIVRV